MRHSTADPRVPTPTWPGCGPPPLVHRPQGHDERSTRFAHRPVPAGTIRLAGGCLQPVLLRGRVDHIDGSAGELIHRYTTVHEPGGLLPVACKTRRASRCAPCAEVYRADTYQLIRAGLTGGKGVPAEVADHPTVFVTLTASSFGPVHARRVRGDRLLACRPRRNGRTCPHGARLSRWQRPRGCRRADRAGRGPVLRRRLQRHVAHGLPHREPGRRRSGSRPRRGRWPDGPGGRQLLQLATRPECRDWPAAASAAEPAVDGTPAVDRDGLHQFVAPTAAESGDGRVLSGPSSCVHEPCS